MKRAASLVVLILLAGGASAFAQVQRPNVVMLIADQLRYESCGYAGDDRAITPNIDRLADEGISFDNYVVNTPVCAATRATLWTGKYASTHGMVVNELRMNPNHDTLGTLLTAKGYCCDYIGKWHLWANEPGRHRRTPNAFCPPGPYRLGFNGFWAAYNFNHGNYDAFFFRDTAERQAIQGWGPVHFTDLAVHRIQHHARTQQPFAMVVSYSPPHDPWTRENVPAWWYDRFRDVRFELPVTWSDTPDRHMDRNTDPDAWLSRWKRGLPEYMRVYYAMTAALDEQVGRVLQALQDNKLERDTIVIFTSDHGEQFGANARVFKMTFFDKSARVPMLIRWPGKIPAGRKSNACMSAVDVMPTVCGMLGVGFPDSTDGIDLSDSTRVDCSCEPDFAFLQGMGHTFQWKDGFEWRAVRDQRFTYARYLVDGEEMLFDNRNDPEQSTNLASSPQFSDDLKRMRQWLAEKMLATRDEFRPCTWYRDNWTENRVILRGARGDFHREMGDSVPVDVNLRSAE
ncbi:MAG: sulfatase [Fuerstiella sp.]